MRYLYTINGQQFDVDIQAGGPAAAIGQAPRFSAASLASMPAESAGELVCAVSAGQVLGIQASVGQTVTQGEVLLQVESAGVIAGAVAPRAGMVKQVMVKKGAFVEPGDVLIVLS